MRTVSVTKRDSRVVSSAGMFPLLLCSYFGFLTCALQIAFVIFLEVSVFILPDMYMDKFAFVLYTLRYAQNDLHCGIN